MSIEAIVGQPPWERMDLGSGSLALWRPAPRLVVSVVSGVLSRQLAAGLTTLLRRTLSEEPGKLLGFYDWQAVSDYDAACRMELTRFAIETVPRGEGMSFLAGAAGPTLAIRAAAMVVPGIEVHSDRGEFEARLRRIVDQRRKT